MKISCLQGQSCLRRTVRDKRLTFSTHGDGVRHTNRVVLPCKHALLLYRVLDDLAEFKYCGPSDFQLNQRSSDHSKCLLTVHAGTTSDTFEACEMNLV